MGAFAVLFNKKKVKIFYSLGFYFNYLRIPAIILLPIWIGNEFYQLFSGGDSHVAYAAHIGGLMGGAVFGFICMKFSLGFNEDVIKESPIDEVPPLMEKALKHIAELDLQTGRLLLKEVLAKDPENIDALTHLFHVDKLDPENEKFHETAKKLIFQLSRKKVPEFPGIPGALLKLARAYRQNGMTTKGAKCLRLICHKYPESNEAQAARESLQN